MLAVFGSCLPPASAGPPPRILEEDFGSDPRLRGWQVAGEASLFQWNATDEQLAVTWDSSQPNSYFYCPLRTYLTTEDDFRIDFDLRLEDISIGTTPGRPYTFEIALGLVNLTEATAPGFLRGTGVDSPNVVEWDYFPDSGFGATVAAAMISQTNAWATSFNAGHDLAPGTVYRFTLDYRAAQRTMAVTMAVDGETTLLDPAVIHEPFGDFAVDTLAICSYSDAGQDPLYAGSVRAHGRLDNVRLELPPPPIRRFRGGLVEGAWRAEFTGWLGWDYTLLRSADLNSGDWTPVAGALEGNGFRQTLADSAPPAGRVFYRLLAEPK